MKLSTIKDNNYFKKIYKQGSSFVGAYVVLYAIKKSDPLRESQFGITVTKKIGKAVVRNRVRRIIKEAIRNNYGMIDQNYDYIIVARVRSNAAAFAEINKNFIYLVNSLKRNKR